MTRTARLAQLAAKPVPWHCMEETRQNLQYSLNMRDSPPVPPGETPGIHWENSSPSVSVLDAG